MTTAPFRMGLAVLLAMGTAVPLAAQAQDYSSDPYQAQQEYQQRLEQYQQQRQDQQDQVDRYQDAQSRYQDQQGAYADQRMTYQRSRSRYEQDRIMYDQRYGDGAFMSYYSRHPEAYDQHLSLIHI